MSLSGLGATSGGSEDVSTPPPHPPVLLLHARAVSAFSLGTPKTSEELWGVKTLRGGYYLQDVFRKCCVFVDG